MTVAKASRHSSVTGMRYSRVCTVGEKPDGRSLVFKAAICSGSSMYVMEMTCKSIRVVVVVVFR